MGIVEQQLKKLLKGKVLLVIDEADLEELIIAAVPSLQQRADELEEENLSWQGRTQARRLRSLASELDSLPRIDPPQIIRMNIYQH